MLPSLLFPKPPASGFTTVRRSISIVPCRMSAATGRADSCDFVKGQKEGPGGKNALRREHVNARRGLLLAAILGALSMPGT